MQFFERMRGTDVIRSVNRFINSKYMLAVLAALTLLANVFALELWVYIAVSLLAIYLCILGKDMLFLAPAVIFMYISPSVTNHPFMNPNSIFYPENGLWIMIAVIVVFFVLLCVRIATDGGFMQFFKVKRKLLLGFLLLGLSFVLGGMGYEEYSRNNLGYSLLLFAAFFVFYYILSAKVNWKEVSKDYFAWMGLFISFTVCIELLGVYIIHADKIFVNGSVVRNYLYTGWGTYTSMSIMMLIGMPCAFYFAATKKFGFIFNLLGNLIFLAIVASQCRGSILFGAIVYVLCVAAVLWRKQNRLQNLVVYGLILLAAIAVLIWQWERIVQMIVRLFEMGDSSRTELFSEGLNQFLQSPVFGQGFFACTAYYHNPAGATFLPGFWHNTFLQMLAACGIVGFSAYLFHRYQTVLLFVKKPNITKTFMALCISTILFTCLLDCHVFNIGVTFVYSILLTFAEKQEEMEKETEDDILIGFFRKIKTKGDN